MYKKSKLKNGLRIILAPMKSTKTVTVLVMVGTGSKNENEKNRGISHFLEHMFFKGTKKRPTTLDITKELDKVGGVYNAFTGKECTGFWTKTDKKHSSIALDIILDMLLNSKFSEEEIKRERGTILEELNMYLDNPIMHISDLFENLLYKDQPLGYDELGDKKTIASVKRKDFIDYYKKHYTNNNIIIAIAGSFSEKKIKNNIKRYFDKPKNNSVKKQNKTCDKQNNPKLFIKYKKTDQTHLCLGTRGYNTDHKDKYVLSILNIILGGNMSSRLFTSVRERNGLAYYIHTSTVDYKDVGYFVAQSGVNNKKCLDAIKIILDEFKKVKEEKISAEEIKRAKDYLKGRTNIALESSDAVASFVANQEMDTGKILTPQEKFAKIDIVTADDLQRVARDIFVDNKLNLALIGPFKDKKKFEKVLKF
ncbi:MAG: insulinase family protein [Candidatus Pacebacteria bacterium]|nr:insulinase family protein [Candidatus Paceibacterota bacterium]